MARQEPVTMATRLTKDDARIVQAAAMASSVTTAALIRVAVVDLAKEQLRAAGEIRAAFPTITTNTENEG